jgi:hypothetical protein
MKNPIIISTIQGTGLSFPIACLGFLFFGNPAIFVLLPIGGGIGFLMGLIMQKKPELAEKIRSVFTRPSSHNDRPNLLTKYLGHENLIIRFTSLLTVGIILFLIAWLLGYYCLPEGVFRAGAEAQMSRSALSSSSTSLLEEWFKIFRANMLPVVFILMGSMLIKVNGISFGYFVALYNITVYGIFVGTNSFAIPHPVRMGPSLDILGRSGPYEMTALILLAAATFFWPRFEVKRIFQTNPERVHPGPHFSWMDVVGIALGVGILMTSNWIEAKMIMNL